MKKANNCPETCELAEPSEILGAETCKSRASKATVHHGQNGYGRSSPEGGEKTKTKELMHDTHNNAS